MMSASPPIPLPHDLCSPRTPPNPNPAALPISNSSPVKTGLYYAEHQRVQFQMFQYKAQNHALNTMKAKEIVNYLKTAGPIPDKSGDPNPKFSFKNFVTSTNTMCKEIANRCFPDTRKPLVLKYTESKTPSHHPSDTRCRPDYVVAYEGVWSASPSICWPSIELVGEKASKGDASPQEKLVTYLHYLLTARPDLRVGLGLLTSKRGVTFFVAVQGEPTTKVAAVAWGAKELASTMFAFIYRLYNPGSWSSTVYSRRTTDGPPLFDLDIKLANGETLECKNFRSIWASNPFRTRTHVLVNPSSKVTVNGKPLTVIKDQLCKKSRFTEKEIYNQIHSDGDVPGVARPTFHAVCEDTLDGSRERRFTGLQEYGRSIMTINTVKHMLMAIYDVLEILRYLRLKRKILHRDISKGNIMIIDSPPSPSPTSKEKHQDICFIKHILDPACDEHETSVLLIDFNHGEHLDSKTDSVHERTTRTGTPGFVARAVEQNCPLPYPPDRLIIVSDTPDAPPAYKSKHPKRYEQFPPGNFQVYPAAGVDPDPERKWRHDLDHESESVFWVFLYWAMGAQPVKRDSEPLSVSALQQFAGSSRDRNAFIQGPDQSGLVDSFFAPLVGLIQKFCLILRTDRFWIPPEDRRSHPEYPCEAFQRLILQFIEDHKDDDFMTYEVDTTKRRIPGDTVQLLSLSSTSAARELAEEATAMRQKRKLEAETQAKDDDRTKKPRLGEAEGNKSDDDVEDSDDEGGGPYEWEKFAEADLDDGEDS